MELINNNRMFKKKGEKDPAWLALCVYGNLGDQAGWRHLPGMAKALAEEMNFDLTSVEYETVNFGREISVWKAGKLVRTYTEGEQK